MLPHDPMISSPPIPSVEQDTVQDATPVNTLLTSAPNKGSNFVISPTEADTPCAAIGIAQLVLDFNRLTKWTHNIADPGVEQLMQWCISNKFDFGVAYGRLRQIWTSPNVARAWRDVMEDGKDIDERKARAFETDASGTRTLVAPYNLPPRRMWDLYSHRVVPLHFVRRRNALWAITHSWREKMVGIMSPVNEREWPVPMPPGVTLEVVRDEMLRLGAEYCWLDVVCNRQRGGRGEELKAGEWAIDLPTMGNIYVDAITVVRYYNGLGCPFRADGLDDHRHWLNRAWTLQELNEDTRIGGMPHAMTAKMPYAPVTGWEYDDENDPFPELSKRLRPLANIIFGANKLTMVVKEMRKRDSGRPLDQIYGMGYLIRAPRLPVYDDSLHMEEAWWLLIQCMTNPMRSELLFLFTEPGTGGRKWFPTWKQLLSGDMVQDPDMAEEVKLRPNGTVSYYGRFLERCSIANDEVTVESGPRKDCTFKFLVRDKECPPTGHYTLVGNTQADYFIVCKLRLDHTALLEKILVVRLRSVIAHEVQNWGLPLRVCVFG